MWHYSCSFLGWGKDALLLGEPQPPGLFCHQGDTEALSAVDEVIVKLQAFLPTDNIEQYHLTMQQLLLSSRENYLFTLTIINPMMTY